MVADPISLAAFFSSILANSAKAVSQIHNLCETYKDAPEDFGYLYSEITVVHKLLVDFQGRCDAALNDRTYPGLEADFTAVNNAEYFMITARAVNSTLTALHARISPLLHASAPFDARNLPLKKPSSKNILKYIWDEKEINKLVQRLQSHKATLTLVLAHFADWTNEDIRRKLKALEGQQLLPTQIDQRQVQSVPEPQVRPVDPVATYNSIRQTTPFTTQSPSQAVHAGQTAPAGTSTPQGLATREIAHSHAHAHCATLLPGNTALYNASTPPPQYNPALPLQEIERFESDGRTAYNGKEWPQASQLLKRAIEARECLGHDAGSLASTRTLYAEALYMDKQYGLAREHFVKLVQWAESNFGHHHRETAKRRMSLAHALEAWGSPSSAREEFKAAALAFERAAGGEDILDSLRCRYKQGVLLTAAGKDRAYDREWPHWEEAEDSLKRAADGLPRFLDPKHDEVLHAKVAYAQVLLWMCRDPEARLQLRLCLQSAQEKRLERDHVQVTRIQSLMRDCSYWLKHPKEAQSPNRMQISKQREARRVQSEGWREITGHW